MSTQNVSVCSVCGERAVVISDDPITVRFREGAYSVDGFEYEHCTACGENVFGSGQVDAMHREAAALARIERGLLAPDEIRVLRFELGLTQEALEHALGMGPGTVVRWERGAVIQSATADRLMRLLRAHPELLAELGAPALIVREGRGPYKKRAK
jgi:putative zinc finger/helix-turn-helix YgiT family protein